ncbi:MAG: glycosyltransferase family 2 protein [Candidatus Melainabacteria bacterium]|nr:glycosyltransferase family 2 protein [Candidatus Melainabacteria bacterium]
MPTVSVIIPTYNRSYLLRQALLSCLAQTYQDFEILVADDGSTDDTREVVESLNSDKIQYLYQTNSGRSTARNRAIKQAQGKYITFLDSDDLYLPQKLAVEVKALDENPSFGMVYSSAYNIDINGKLHPYVYPAPTSGWIYKDIALYLPLTICLPTVMARREIFSKVGVFDERQNRFEDTDMWRRISKKYRILAIDEPLCKIRYHEGNEMEHPERVFEALKSYTNKVLWEDTLRYGLHLRFLAARLCVHYGLAVRNHINPEYKRYSYQFFRLALKYSPYWFVKRRLIDYLDQETAAPIVRLLQIRRKALDILKQAGILPKPVHDNSPRAGNRFGRL